MDGPYGRGAYFEHPPQGRRALSIHKILTENRDFVLAFSGRLGYHVLALKFKEC